MRAEILRGMQVEAAPFRLQQTGATPAAGPAASALEAVPTEPDRLQERVDAAVRDLRDDAVRAGYAEGLQRGESAGAAKVQAAVDGAVAAALDTHREQQEHLCVLAGELKRTAPVALALAEDEMVAACFETLCRMLGETLADPKRIQAHLRHVLAAAASGTVLRVHPDDATMMEAAAQDTGRTWVADPAIRLGGCVLQGPVGSLDLRLETLLESCKAAMLQARVRRASTAAAALGERE